MTTLEKKVLKHVASLIDEIDFMECYRAIDNQMEKQEIPKDKSRAVLHEYSKTIENSRSQVRKIQEWIGELLNEKN